MCGNLDLDINNCMPAEAIHLDNDFSGIVITIRNEPRYKIAIEHTFVNGKLIQINYQGAKEYFEVKNKTSEEEISRSS